VRLHHTGVLVRDIAEAASRYERLGYERKSGLIQDPLQQARVQFFRLPGETVLLELIAPDSEASHLSVALEKSGGLHHLCYAVEGVDAVCADLRSKGLSLVRPPTPAVAFGGRRIAWLMGRDRLLVELLERGPEGEL
jgi:methylmalonyl-CoA/ethylmalonyl-CoA epimerase